MKNKYIGNIILCAVILFCIFFPIKILGYGGSFVSPSPEVDEYSLAINNGDEFTVSNIVELKIYAKNTANMAVSNAPNFINVYWEPYATSKSWTLLPGEGTRTVYIKFKSASGTQSSVISKSIILQKPISSKGPDINKDGRVDDFDFSILMANWGTPYNNDADINDDGIIDDFDLSIILSAWTI